MKKFAMAAVAAASLLAAQPLWAAGISNKNESLNQFTFISNTLWRAASFQVASDHDYELSDVTFALPRGGTAVTTSIYSDVSLNPGSLLENLTRVGPSVYTSSGLNLTADSTYWAVLGGLGEAASTSSDSESGDAGWSISDFTLTSTNSGATWGNLSVNTLQFAVNATPAAAPVPEPSTLALMALGGLALLRRRVSA